MDRAGRAGRGLAGLFGLVALVVGVPVALSAVGQGPVVHFGGFRAFGDGLVHPVTDSTLVRVAALACWLVWLLFVMAVAIEVLAAIRTGAGRAKTKVRVPALQGAANALLLSALLLLPQRGMAAAGAVVRRPSGAGTAVAAAAPVALPRQDRNVASSVPRMVTRPTTATMVSYVVQRYDSPWGIAERHLGDGTRWRELRDQHGRSLSVETANRTQARIIRPGEVLLLPVGAARSVAFTAAAMPATAVANHTSKPQPTRPPAATPVASPARVGPAVPAAPPREAPPAAAPAPAPAPAATPKVPAARADALAPAVAAEGSAGTETVDPTPDTVLTPPVLSVPVDRQNPTPDPAPVLKEQQPTSEIAPVIVATKAARHAREASSSTLVEAGLLSAGVLVTLEGLRRRQAQHRPAGRRLRLPGRALACTELAMRVGAQPGEIDRIDRALHRLVADLQLTETAVPSILAVVAGPSSVEILVDRPLAPPAPWTASSEGFRWRLTTAHLTPAPAEGSAPLPGLVPVGRAGGDGPEVLVNLEAAGVLSVVGDSRAADALIRAMATSLSGLTWARAVNLILVGFGAELEAVDNVRAVPSLVSVLEELQSTADLMKGAIGDTDPFAARVGRPGGDSWAPTIVCCASTTGDAERGKLVGLAAPGSGVIAVINGLCESTAWTIDVDSRPITVQPLRLAVEPTLLPAQDLRRIGELYEVALDESGATSDEAPYKDLDISADRPPSVLEDDDRRVGASAEGSLSASNTNGASPMLSSAPAIPIWVSVLGTIEIEGARVFKRAKSRELAVYLALHPNGVGEAELDEAMWPSGSGRLVAPSTRDSTVSVARTALGGPTRLLPAQGQSREKRYQVSGDVGTDWTLFCQLHRDGRATNDAELLGQALELVRGRPFEGVIAGRTYGWVHTEGHARQIEAEVADAADLAAGLLLANGQAIEARRAARRGLTADPFVERLWVRLMEGADQLGDSQEIERLIDEMDVALELEGDFSGLHPHTLAAYDRLSRRHRLPT